jgi:hypothetical protein
MKPKPFWLLNHFTVPVTMRFIPIKDLRFGSANGVAR